MTLSLSNRTVIADANGCATPEFVRAWLSLTARVGGTTGDAVDEVFANPTFSQGGYESETYQIGPVKEAWPEVFQPLAVSYELSLKEDKANKDASGGYAGLTGYSINFKNALGTFTSLLANANTAIRTYTFPDRTITVAGVDDITGGLQAANFTGYSASGTPGITATIDLATALTIVVKNGLITGQT